MIGVEEVVMDAFDIAFTIIFMVLLLGLSKAESQ